MSKIEHLERSGPQGQRRKYQPRSGSHHLQADRRVRVLQASDCIKASTPPQLTGYTPVLEELALEYMSQDCSSLRKQLLRLKMLLQLEDPDSPPDVPVEIEDNTTALQFEELIKEVQMLRAELRTRDRTIAQLALQCRQLKQQQEQKPPQGQPSRCQCHHQRAPSSLRQGDRQTTDRRTQHRHDKATQTYWRSPNHTPQILQPLEPRLSEHLQQARAVKAPPTEGRSEPRSSRAHPGTHAGAHPPVPDLPVHPDKLSAAIGPGASWEEEEEAEEEAEARDSPGSPAAMLQGSAASSCPRLLQPLRLQKRVALPALKPGATAGIPALRSGSPAAHPPRQLPPPSRGLPSFHAEPQVHPRSLCGASLLQPRRASRPPRDARGTSLD